MKDRIYRSDYLQALSRLCLTSTPSEYSCGLFSLLACQGVFMRHDLDKSRYLVRDNKSLDYDQKSDSELVQK